MKSYKTIENISKMELYKSQNERLMNQLEILTHEFAGSRDRIKKLEKKLIEVTEYNIDINGLNTNIEGLYDVIAETENENKRLENELFRSLQINTNNKDIFKCLECERSKHKLQKVRDKLEKLEKSLEQREIIQRKKENETVIVLEKCEKGREKLLLKVDELEKSASSVINVAEENVRLKESIKSKDNEIDDLTKNNERLYTELQDYKSKFKELENKEQLNQESVEKLKENQRIIEDNTEELVKNAIKGMGEKYENEKRNFLQKISDLEANIQLVDIEKKELEKQIIELNLNNEYQINEMKNKIEKNNEIEKKYMESKEEMEQQLLSMNERLEMRTRQIGELTAEIARRAEQEKQICSRTDRLQDELNELKKKLSNTILQNNSLIEQINEYEILLNQETNKITKLSKDLINKEKHNQELQEQIGKEQKIKEDIKIKVIEKKDNEIKQIQEQYIKEQQYFKEENEKLIEKINNIQLENDEIVEKLKKENNNKNNNIEQLQMKIETLKHKYDVTIEIEQKKQQYYEKIYQDYNIKEKEQLKQYEFEIEKIKIKYNEENDNLKNKIENEIKLKDNKVKEYNELLNKYEMKIMEKDNIEKQFKVKINHLNNDIEQKNNTIKKMGDEIKKLKESIDLSQAKIRLYETKKVQLTKASQTIDVYNEAKELKTKLLEEQLNELERLLQLSEEGRQEMELKLKRYKELEYELEKFKRNESKNIEKALNEERVHLNEIWSQKLDTVTNECKILRSSILRFQMEAIEKSREIDRLEQECRERTTALEERLGQLNEVEKLFVNKLNEVEDNLKISNEKEIELNHLIEEKNKQIQEIEKKNKEFQQLIKEYNIRNKENIKQINDYESDLCDKKGIIKELLERINERDKMLEKRENNRELLIAKTSELGRVSKQLFELRKSSAETETHLTKELEKLQIQITNEKQKYEKQLKFERKTNTEKIEELKERVKLWEKRINESEIRAKERAEELENVKSEIIENESTISDLSREIRIRSALLLKFMNQNSLKSSFIEQDSKLTEITNDGDCYQDLSLHELLDKLSFKYTL